MFMKQIRSKWALEDWWGWQRLGLQEHLQALKQVTSKWCVSEEENNKDLGNP